LNSSFVPHSKSAVICQVHFFISEPVIQAFFIKITSSGVTEVVKLPTHCLEVSAKSLARLLFHIILLYSARCDAVKLPLFIAFSKSC
jgi:hypothetical protein